MTSLSRLKEDLPTILSDISWLLDEGFNYQVESEYTLKLVKGHISILIYYGRYSDPTDVLIEIASQKSDLHENGSVDQYSVFEAAIIDSTIPNPPRSDGYDTVKMGIELLKQHKQLFDLDYLKRIRNKYSVFLRNNLPKHLRDLT